MLRPLNDRVVIEPRKADTQSVGGIILPEQKKRQGPSSEGTVIAVGPGRLDRNGERVAPIVKIGDKVIYAWAGNDIEMDRKKYRILNESDILAILD